MLVAESADQRPALSSDEVSDAIRQLIRIGYDNLEGYLEGGIEAWARSYPVETIPSMKVTELRERLDEVTVVDVRQTSEWEAGHIPNAIHFEGGRIPWEKFPFAHDTPVAIQCGSGNRSMIAISVLRRRGFHNLIQVEGGINQWKKHGFEIEKD